MATYYKPQSPIQSGEDFIYPITTADQVKVDKDTRLNAVGVYLKNIDNSTDTTVYGNNATTLGGVAASDYALKTDTAPDSSKLGGKAPEYYIQPRNLLDNSDFTNPVNQRGANAYSFDSGYTIDRWKLYWTGDGNITIQKGYITLYRQTHQTFLFQFPENVEKMVGKTYTVAAKVRYNGYIGWIDSTQRTNSGMVHLDNWEVITHTFTVGSKTSDIGSAGVEIASDGNLSFELEWIALYEGSYTAETLPPYVPKGYAAELAECMRYYEFVGIHKYSIGRIGEVYFDIQFTQKRTNPTVTIVLEVASNNITNRGEVWNANRVSVGGLLYYANDANLSYWYGSAVVSADL